MDKKFSLAGLFVMIGLIVIGFSIPIAVSRLKSYDRVVDVKGLCEVEVPADKVIWPISFAVASDDISYLYSQIDKSTSQITSFLTKGGIKPEQISISTPVVSDKYMNEYGNTDRTWRYIAKGVITVCTEDVDTARELMERQSELLKAGVNITANNWENTTQFRFEGLNDIKPQMIEDATRNARQAAEKFAKDSGSKIGKIRSASQGTFSISDRDSNTPYIKTVRVVTYVTYYLKK